MPSEADTRANFIDPALAREQHVSVNQLISAAVAEKISELMTETYLTNRAAKGTRKDFENITAKVPDVPADPHDAI